jgi:sec-independent protein translocase protein TatC
MTDTAAAAAAEPHPLDAGRMTLWEHLAELRNRLIKSAIAVAVGAVVGWFLYPYVVEFLVQPYKDVQPNAQLYTTSLHELFTIRLQVSVYIGIIIAMPVLLYQVWRFVTPGLYPNEKKYAIPFVISATVLFIFGAVVAYLVLPAAIRFFLGVAGSDITPLPTVDSYLMLNLFMMLTFGLGFEFPVLLVALQTAGVLTPRKLNSWRRPAIVIIAIVAAVITPSGDPISMLALAVPMYIFYELSILIGFLITWRQRKRKAKEAAQAGV